MSSSAPTLASFFAQDSCSIKICGVKTAADAQALVDLGIAALGVNFWPLSKRFIEHDEAAPWLREVATKILRVGVFVNATSDLIEEIYSKELIDIAQLHGDETPEQLSQLLSRGVPCIKALGIRDAGDVPHAQDYVGSLGLLLDTAAPGVYGGTGATFDWSLAQDVQALLPQMPILLAGGITAENAESAVVAVRPCAIDIASGAEISPGVKDIDKVRAIQSAVNRAKTVKAFS
jgi:phosphoribosylanthranilate isomerase